MIEVAVVYHSGYGHTKKQAEAVAKGVNSVDGVQSKLIEAQAAEQSLDILSSADAIIFGSPTYMGAVSAPFKAFMDASSAAWMEQKWKNKIAAGFTNSHSMSGDKLNTLVQMAIFAAQHGMIWVGQAEMNASPEGEAGKADVVNRIGSFLGAMAQSDNVSPDIAPPSGDLKTAEALGARVANVTKQFVG